MSFGDNVDTERETPETGMGECAVSGFLMQKSKCKKMNRWGTGGVYKVKREQGEWR